MSVYHKVGGLFKIMYNYVCIQCLYASYIKCVIIQFSSKDANKQSSLLVFRLASMPFTCTNSASGQQFLIKEINYLIFGKRYSHTQTCPWRAVWEGGADTAQRTMHTSWPPHRPPARSALQTQRWTCKRQSSRTCPSHAEKKDTVTGLLSIQRK